MNEHIDHAAGRTRVSGAAAHTDDTELSINDRRRLSKMAAEMRTEALVKALTAALAGAPHWRHEAQVLLTLIDAGILPWEPTL